MIRLLGTAFAALFGLAFGSFLNVCLSRWPRQLSVTAPRSHCPHCFRTLAWWENVPVLSWIALRGLCRTCRAPIGWRYPAVELAIGTLWAVSAWQVPRSLFYPTLPAAYFYNYLLILAGKLIFYWLLVALAFLDAEHLWLPDWLTLPGAVLGYVFVLLEALLLSNWGSLPPRLFDIYDYAFKKLLGILAAAALILVIRMAYWLLRRREGLGLGDAKLMALLAAWLGLPGALLAFALGVVLGALVAVALLAVPQAPGKWALKKLPLGTFLSIGGIVSSIWGQAILAAYLRWAGL